MFWPKSLVNPFEKTNMASMWNPYFYSLGGLVFYLNDHQNIISRPILSKDKIFIFWPKSWVNPSEKNPNIASV